MCGYYFLPNQHSGDVASTIQELQLVDVNVYKFSAAVTVPGVHRFGNFNINAVQGGPSPALTETMTLPAGTLYIPMNQGNKHWIQGVLDENPFLPFNYNYGPGHVVVPAAARPRRGRLPHAAAAPREPRSRRSRIPAQGTAPRRRRPCTHSTRTRCPGWRWSTSSSARARASRVAPPRSTPAACTTPPAPRWWDGASVGLSTIAADAAQWQTPVYGLASYPVGRFALPLPKIAVYPGGTTVPTNPAFHGTGDGQCTSTRYCEAIFSLTQKEKIPTSQIGQLTSTDIANGVLVSGNYTVLIIPRRRSRRPRPSAPPAPGAALQAFINAGGMYVGTNAPGATSLRNAGVTTVNTNTISGINTPGSTFDATWNTSDPVGWGFDAGGWIYRESSNDPNYDPTTLAGNGTTIPAATAVATYAPAGDCGGPAGFGNCYGYQVNANQNLPGRPAVIDQPFGSGHAIMLGFDAWYRAWTLQNERLVLNAILYPPARRSRRARSSPGGWVHTPRRPRLRFRRRASPASRAGR